LAFCAHCGKELPVGATFCPACGTPVQGATATMGSTIGPSAAPMSGFESVTKDSKAQDYWVRRFVAFVIDAILVFVVFYILITIVVFTATFPFLFAGAFAPFALVFGTLAILGGVVFILYFTILEASRGATIGKGMFGLKVRSKTGSNPTLGEAFIRNLSKIYWLLLLLDIVVGLAISKGYQQKYSDTLVGTTVVSTRT
jgi:uncharacterized RDD family membrane protein YckC